MMRRLAVAMLVGLFACAPSPVAPTPTPTPGLQIGAPSGGDKGAGTLNVASSIWVNGTQLVNYAPSGYTGSVQLATPGGGSRTLNFTDGLCTSVDNP